MAERYQLDFQKSEDLEKAMAKIPLESERVVNEALHTSGSKEMVGSIIGFVNIGARTNGRHAKLSKSLRSNHFNLGFEVYAAGGAANNSGSFGYLVFPNEGRGKRNPVAQRFFETGADKANEKIVKDLMTAIEEVHQKNLV